MGDRNPRVEDASKYLERPVTYIRLATYRKHHWNILGKFGLVCEVRRPLLSVFGIFRNSLVSGESPAESIGCRHRLNPSHSRASEVPVKWAFSRKASLKTCCFTPALGGVFDRDARGPLGVCSAAAAQQHEVAPRPRPRCRWCTGGRGHRASSVPRRPACYGQLHDSRPRM